LWVNPCLLCANAKLIAGPFLIIKPRWSIVPEQKEGRLVYSNAIGKPRTSNTRALRLFDQKSNRPRP
jgi:hypothetical protein